jgi:hypothetical protein
VHIESVESPRQRLEDFFMGIVETARAEQASTSGAAQAGPTAAFLRDEGADGDDLIDALSSEQPEEAPLAVERSKQSASGDDSSKAVRTEAVLDELMNSSNETPPESKETGSLPKVDESVDSGFIDDLLGDSDQESKE